MTGDMIIDIHASLETLARNEHDRGRGPLKLTEDLERYERIIEESRPDLIIETGTLRGDSASWFAEVARCRVITIDVEVARASGGHPDVTYMVGSSLDPWIFSRVSHLVDAFQRIMVSLDSDHSTAHVAGEIALYAPLVSQGCYLVVEDGIFHYADAELRAAHGLGDMIGNPLAAVMSSGLPHSSRWERARGVEALYPVTHNLAGWWKRV